MKITKEQIISTYSGKVGCCCGCLGNHRYPSDPKLRELAGKNRGRVILDDEVNDRSMAFILNKLNKNIKRVKDEKNHYFLQIGQRYYIAYKLPEVK